VIPANSPSHAITDLPPHGGQLPALGERFGIPASQLLDFSANINPEGPPLGALDALRASLEDHSTITDYPDLRSLALKRALAGYAGVGPEQIAVANGFVPLLQASLGSLPIRRCLLPVPGFGEYRRSLEHAGIEVVPVAVPASANFLYDPDVLLEPSCDAMLLANPQNPSGVAHSLSEILTLIHRAAERNIFVLLDEAFIDYLPGESLAPYVASLPNLVVFRSITKFFAMPGLRVAYTIALPERIARINRHLAPWPITTLAANAAAAAVSDQAYAKRSIALNHQRRNSLHRQLESMGLQVYPAAANFLLLCIPEPFDALDLWQRLIVEHHIVTRSCANYEALPPSHLRIAVRTDRDNLQLLTAFQHLLQPAHP
jgi:threonine-phosphate decarboxylase